MAYGNLGVAFYSRGEFDRALDMHQKHLAIALHLGDVTGQATAYCNLGNVYHALGDFKRAIDMHQQRLAIARRTGDLAGEGRA